MTSLDPLEYRHDFPILNRKVNGKPMVYLDNTASAQTPKCVVETIEHIYYNAKANVHRGVHSLSQEATANMETARERVRKFINAESTDEVILHAAQPKPSTSWHRLTGSFSSRATK